MRVLWILLLITSLSSAGGVAQQLPAPPMELVRQVAQASTPLPALPLKEAHRTLGTARRQFQGRRPTGAQLYVVAQGLNEAATPELLVVRVLTWQGPQLTGLIVRVPETHPPAPIELEESAVQDWLLLHSDGREEGNYLGKFWDLEQRLTEQGE
ncbi:hypothetical protein [Hymenobacter metallilatus]|uniref:DUF2314 domain-containing protein n=1 Tax=Hymenobacter metallilatus TaxID=2493666 RepID=A0A428JTD5_9BACT|nr:hypothetical protein [Hymenobacter metallilatus]RSK37397.1 hypothetical protein EI290_01730 [Hymenobacter metallilatus]